ncbi:NAD(P)/FAD-dependent oxidoreductase [Paenibacillus sp. HJL G12]|uniref:NAD(P)/FAD-dependent oxidoreductase n=1 Tax=Paenibacillus dendrobii TaxID=2691084 RepID=A0A7X3IEE9_9BACL|nr:NAD(P)/FAD-dependent oxidoreductase [Paenibacillus dendrobii]MWV42399.1 NAD(P)/FAD-dependent oxidoreductase [Paenibacillus dendrobii]
MPDAVIIGGGLSGSSLAIRLANLGWNTVLLDRQMFPRHKACGEFLSPETQEMFRELGVMEQLEALQPARILKSRIIFRHGGAVEAELSKPAWGLSRYALDSVMLQAAEEAGVEVRTGTAVSSVAAEIKGFRIGTRTGGASEILHSRSVYAAWGVHPRGDLMGEPQVVNDKRRRAYIGFKAHFTGIGLDQTVELYFVRGGYVGISPVENGRANIAALLPLDWARGKGSSVSELLLSAAAENAKLWNRLQDGILIPDTQVSAAPVYLSGKPSAWSIIPQVGDAGAMIPPLFGDGMSAALRSARICASYGDQFLRGDRSMESWKDAYLLDMSREYDAILRWGHLLQALGSMPVIPRLWTAGTKVFPQLAEYMVQATRLNGKSPLP